MSSAVPIQILTFVFLYLLSATVTFVLAIYVVFRGTDDRALQAFGILLVAIIVWSAAKAARLLTDSLGGKIIWQWVAYIGVVVAPTAFLVFVLYYTGKREYTSTSALAFLAIEPLITFTLLLTNGSHQLYYQSIDTIFLQGAPLLRTVPGVGFWFHTLYSYVVVTVAVVILVRFALHTERLYRIQTVSLLSGSLIPLGANVVFLVGLSPNPAFDLTPPTFALSALFIFVGVLYGRFSHFLPVPRESVLNTLTDGVLVVESDNRVSYINSPAKSLLEQSIRVDETESLIGKPLSTVLPVVTAIEQTDAETDSSTGFEASVRRNGTTRWFWIRHHVLDSSVAGSTVVNLTEITERKERERKANKLQRVTWKLMRLDDPEDIAAVAVEAAKEVFSLPLSGIHLVDDDNERLGGTAATDSVREEFGSIPVYEREGKEQTDAVIWKAFLENESLAISDTSTMQSLAAEESPVRSVIIQPLGDHGVFIVSSPETDAFDSTDVALIEILAVTVTAALDQAESKRTLRANQQRLERQNERLEEFTSVVSHDLRSPLNTATGYLELLQTDYDDDRIDKLEGATTRMKALIDDLLTLARQGKTVDERTTVELEDIARQAWESVPSSGMKLTIEDDTGRVPVDESRLRQAFENLFRNTAEHAVDASEIRIGGLDADSGFFFEDDGPGIPPDRRDEVFEHGFTTTGAGTGFGLAIVKRIIEAHDWEIRVREGRAGGARFEVTGLDFHDR